MHITTVRRLARQSEARAAARLGRQVRRAVETIEAAYLLHATLNGPKQSAEARIMPELEKMVVGESMKKPRFKPRVMLADEHGNTYHLGEDPSDKTRVRITDARDLTAEQAIADTITRNVYLEGDGPLGSTHVPEGYSATVKNGKVKVWRIKE